MKADDKWPREQKQEEMAASNAKCWRTVSRDCSHTFEVAKKSKYGFFGGWGVGDKNCPLDQCIKGFNKLFLSSVFFSQDQRCENLNIRAIVELNRAWNSLCPTLYFLIRDRACDEVVRWVGAPTPELPDSSLSARGAAEIILLCVRMERSSITTAILFLTG